MQYVSFFLCAPIFGCNLKSLTLDGNTTAYMHKLLLVILFAPFTVFGSGENFHIGGRSAGLGHASVTLSDLWSVHHNQAGLGLLENAQAGFFYESRFMLSELSLKGAAAVIPTKSGTFGLSVSSFGYSLYGENKYGLAYGRKLNSKVSVGVQLNYHNIRIAENYGNKNTLSMEGGLLAQLTTKLSLGAHIYNPTRAKVSDYDNERLPTIYRFGMNYKFSDKVFIAAEAEKDVDHNAVFKVGVEYHVMEILYLRGGIATNPVYSSFGFGIELKQFKLDIASEFHQVLGHTPQLSLLYTF